MGKTLEFEDVKVGDQIIKNSSGFGSEKYSIGTVNKVTATRFTVDFDGHAIVFTKDGHRYPRETGYSRSYSRIEKSTPELLKIASNHKNFSNAQYTLRTLGEKVYTLKFENVTEAQIKDFYTAVKKLKEITDGMRHE